MGAGDGKKHEGVLTTVLMPIRSFLPSGETFVVIEAHLAGFNVSLFTKKRVTHVREQPGDQRVELAVMTAVAGEVRQPNSPKRFECGSEYARLQCVRRPKDPHNCR